VRCVDGALQIVSEGRHRKFCNTLQQLAYSGELASREGRSALSVTERAVFSIEDGDLTLQEIAPGIDLERDILAHLDFAPKLASPLQTMDARLFAPAQMGLMGSDVFTC